MAFSWKGENATLFTYLLAMHPNENEAGFLDDLYGRGVHQSGNEQALSCKAVFENLGSVSQHYIMRLLWVGNRQFKAKDLVHYVYQEHEEKHLEAIRELMRHRVLLATGVGRDKMFYLNTFFSTSFKYALTTPLNPMVDGSPSDKIKAIQEEVIEKRCAKRWNVVLNCLLHPEVKSNRAEAPTAVDFFRRKQLIAHVGGGTAEEITARGYEYLLKPKSLQIWAFVLERLEFLKQQQRPDAAMQVVSLLFKLAYCQYKRWYSDDNLTASQKELLGEFAQLGIVFKEKSGVFFPTRTAIGMLYESSAAGRLGVVAGGDVGGATTSVGTTADDDEAELQLITETTFQVIAYLESDLHFEMIQLFMDIEMRLPGMTVGRITREKVHSAFKKNITAAQILHFLNMYAHPNTVREGDFAVPPNVRDQIVVWWNETTRITAHEAVVYDLVDIVGEDFSVGAFDNVLTHTQDMDDAVLWADRSSQMLAVKYSYREHFDDMMAQLQ